MLLCYLAQDPVGALVPPRMMDTTNSASRLWLSSSAAGSAGTRRSEPAAARGADTVLPWNRTNRLKSMTAVVAGFLSGASALDPSALADTEVELADLPPPFVPVLFGLGLLVVSTFLHKCERILNNSTSLSSSFCAHPF